MEGEGVSNLVVGVRMVLCERIASIDVLCLPAVTEPPGEFMYRWIGFWGLSASRKRSWATMEADIDSSTSPFKHMMRSWFC